MAKELKARGGSASPGSWKKGQSGNPGGRPRIPLEFRSLAREYSVEALSRIIALMRSADERISLAACEIVLDRAWGRPAQMVVTDQTKRFVVEMPLQGMSEEQWLKTIQSPPPKMIDQKPSGDPNHDRLSS